MLLYGLDAAIKNAGAIATRLSSSLE